MEPSPLPFFAINVKVAGQVSTIGLALQFDSAGDSEGKEHAKEGLDKARAKSDKYKGRVEDLNKPQPPKVEVWLGSAFSNPRTSLRGSLEKASPSSELSHAWMNLYYGSAGTCKGK